MKIKTQCGPNFLTFMLPLITMLMVGPQRNYKVEVKAKGK